MVYTVQAQAMLQNAMMMDRSANNGDRTWAYMIDTLGATITTKLGMKLIRVI